LVLVYGNISDNLGLGLSLGLGLGRRKELNNLGIGIGSGIASHAVASSSFLPHKASTLNIVYKKYHNHFLVNERKNWNWNWNWKHCSECLRLFANFWETSSCLLPTLQPKTLYILF